MNNDLRSQVAQMLFGQDKTIAVNGGNYNYGKDADELITIIRTAALIEDSKITRLTVLAVKHCPSDHPDFDEIVKLCEEIDNLRGNDE